MASTVLVGTSGWVYRHWSGSFYPPRWPQKRLFEFYVSQFPTVEVNATFYRLASKAMVARWHAVAPEPFVFALKGSRFITHMKRLRDPRHALARYFNRLKPMEARGGIVLWQLPPQFQCTVEHVKRLERFLKKLPPTYRHAVEFRHRSWNGDTVNALLHVHRVAKVWVSSLAMPVELSVTTDFVYLRFHGLALGAHHHYSTAELKPWATALKAANRPAYAYFNNDLNPRVVDNARVLQRLVGSAAVVLPTAQRKAPGAIADAPANVWRAW